MILLFCAAGLLLAVLMPLFARRLPRQGPGFVAALLPLAVLLATTPVAGAVLQGEPLIQELPWVPSLNLGLSFHLDGLSLLFVWLICAIALFVFLYAGAYMASSDNAGRFFSYLILFTIAMLGVVTAGNLLSLFVFWELTSITSYLLIGFKTGSEASRKSALRALLVTGGGGLAMLAGILLLGQAAGTMSLSEIVERGDVIRADGSLVAITTLILLGALTKSAQAPFHFWLPGAMAAPTPVSAFLHSATMVKAGVYLVARLNPVFSDVPSWTWPLIVVGGATMLMGAVRAPFKHDLKQILAYATVSVLGMLMLLLGIGHDKALKAAMVLLIAHGLYKAALFLSAGTVDLATGTRDVRALSGLRAALPQLFPVALLATLSMIGLPPFIGFLAKEVALEALLVPTPFQLAIMIAFIITGIALMVAAWRAGIQPFLGPQNDRPGTSISQLLWLMPLLPAGLGLFFGLVPKALQPLILAAATDVAGRAVPVKLALWHGLTPALFISLGMVATGGILIWVMGRPKEGKTTAIAPSPFAASRLFDKSFEAVLEVARRTAGLLDGRAPSYGLSIIFTSFIVLGVSVLLLTNTDARMVPDIVWEKFDFMQIGIGILILAATVIAVFANSMLIAAAALGAAGFGIASLFFLYGAVDLAATQILVDTLVVLLFVLVVYRFPKFTRLSDNLHVLRDSLIALGMGTYMTIMIWKAKKLQYGDPISVDHAALSVPEAYGRNIVNVTLVDFRALDTLGEITVLMIAALGVTALIHQRNKK